MIKIQHANINHVDEIGELWYQLMQIHKELDADYFSNVEEKDNKQMYKEDILICIKQSTQIVLVAIDKDKVIGYCNACLVYFSNTFYNTNSHCEINDIMISEKYQNSCVGKQLINDIKQWALKSKVKIMQVNVFSKNQRALHFFNKQDFQPLFHKLQLQL